MAMKLLMVMVAVAGCGEVKGAQHPKHETMTENVLSQFVEHVNQKDVAAIENALQTPLAYGGLWFSDPDCVRRFPAAGRIEADRIHAFAICLSTMTMHPSPRQDAVFGVGVVDIDPGFEVEVGLKFVSRNVWVRSIGFAGRRNLTDALPTVQQEVFEANRIAGDPAPMPDATLRAALDTARAATKRPFDYAWMKVCIDGEGNVSSVKPRETTSVEWIDAVTAAISTWKFKPFLVGTQPLPVCVQERLTYPADPTHELRLPVLTDQDDAVMIAPTAVERTTGDKVIAPDDDVKTALSKLGGGMLVSAFKVCFDQRGTVVDVTSLAQSGSASWDQKIDRTIRATWRYSPFIINGAPQKACTSVTFIYHQG